MGKVKFLCLSTAMALFCAAALGAAWTTKRLTRADGYAHQPAVAISGANIYVVWWNYYSTGDDEICFRKSTDSGATWQSSKRLTYNAGDSMYPAIAVSGLNVYVVWKDDTLGNTEIYLRKSGDGGATWQSSKRLTTNAGDSFLPAIAVSGANVYVAWSDNTPGNYEIYFKKSTDGGATWKTAQRLTNNTGSSYSPDIKVNGANIYVVWCDYTTSDIYFRKSTDSGATWNTFKQLTATSGRSWSPALAVNGANIYMVWCDETPGNWEIYLRKSTSYGATWQTAQRLTNNSGISMHPAIAVSGTNIYVMWGDNTPGQYELYFRKSANSGATWQTAQRLTNKTGASEYPAIAVNNANVYVVWEYEYFEGGYSIFLKYSPL